MKGDLCCRETLVNTCPSMELVSGFEGVKAHCRRLNG